MTDEVDWQVGDRVFAPWEPMWLYPATILCIDTDEEKGNVAFIKFDDNDRALLALSELRSVAIRPGGLVFAKAESAAMSYKPSIVLGMSDNGLRLRFTETSREALVPISDCRLLNSGSEED